MVDVARRLCEDNQITVQEIWSYHSIGDQVRFNLVHRSKEVPAAVVRSNGKANGKANDVKVPERPVKKAAPPKPAPPKPVKPAPKAAKPKSKKPVPKVKKAKRK